MENNVLRGVHSRRSSNIELLKIVAILLIIISHCVQTLDGANSEFMPSADYVLSLSAPTTDPVRLVLTFFRYFGEIGNTLFFACSAWFLVDREKKSNKKVLDMLLDVWLVSVVILLAVYPFRHSEISTMTVVKCLLPSTFSNNWYITSYILFFLTYPALNTIMRQLPQKLHLTLILSSFFLTCVYIPLFREWGASIDSGRLLMWTLLYFAIGYIKHYMPTFTKNVRANLLLLLFSVIGLFGSILLFNFLGLRHSFFAGRLANFITTHNLFILTLAVSLLNLFGCLSLQSGFINSLSSLSLLIYIIHENLLLRRYYRPLFFARLYEAHGYSHILAWVLLLVLVLFAASAILAFLYSKTLQKLTRKASDRLYPLLTKLWDRFLGRLLHRSAPEE